MNRLYGQYKRSAKRRNLIFKLSKKHFKKLTSSPCHYCGALPSGVCFEHNTNKNNQSRSAYVYNGIDRVNNSKGYTIDNCVSCCKVHNQWKKAMSYTDFVMTVINTAKYLTRKYET